MGVWGLLRLGAFWDFMDFWKWGLEIAYFWPLGFGCPKNDVVMLVVVYALLCLPHLSHCILCLISLPKIKYLFVMLHMSIFLT